MLNQRQYSNPLVRNKSIDNALYKGFWDRQKEIHSGLNQKTYDDGMKQVSELDKYKQGEINRVKEEVKEYERTHGNSGGFGDVIYGIKGANKMFLQPFNKYVAPILKNAGGVGKAIGESTQAFGGVVDKL
jgi:hypothetical protein